MVGRTKNVILQQFFFLRVVGKQTFYSPGLQDRQTNQIIFVKNQGIPLFKFDETFFSFKKINYFFSIWPTNFFLTQQKAKYFFFIYVANKFLFQIVFFSKKLSPPSQKI